jgi:hypothetical protein
MDLLNFLEDRPVDNEVKSLYAKKLKHTVKGTKLPKTPGVYSVRKCPTASEEELTGGVPKGHPAQMQARFRTTMNTGFYAHNAHQSVANECNKHIDAMYATKHNEDRVTCNAQRKEIIGVHKRLTADHLNDMFNLE